MKIRFRKELLNHVLYIVFTKTEWVGGINSLIGEDKGIESRHYPLFDFDDSDITVIRAFLERYRRCGLSKTIYIMSDKERHFRVIGTNNISWKNYLYLLHGALTYGLDYQFYRWSIIRGYGTIRLSKKNGREENKIVAIYNYDGSDFNFNGKQLHVEYYQADSDGLKVGVKF